MNRRVFTSALVIMMALAAMGGATMAWFTAQDETQNVFTAGTLEMNATDDWDAYPGDDWTNANPGDCEPKDFTVENTGSKTMHLRFNFTGEWTDGGPTDPDPDLVSISPGDGYQDDWIAITDDDTGEEWWYYQGPTDGIINAAGTIDFTFMVCLDGPGTTNEYQDATYTLGYTFQAVQTTHEAVFEQWGVAFIKDDDNGVQGWYEVALSGETWTTVDEIGDNPAYYEWDGEAWGQ